LGQPHPKLDGGLADIETDKVFSHISDETTLEITIDANQAARLSKAFLDARQNPFSLWNQSMCYLLELSIFFTGKDRSVFATATDLFSPFANDRMDSLSSPVIPTKSRNETRGRQLWMMRRCEISDQSFSSFH
jgi:hypothetical protein